jgi:hypothetical protein
MKIVVFISMKRRATGIKRVELPNPAIVALLAAK